MKEPDSQTIKPVTSYESQTRKDYSEFGQEGLGVENWGTMISPSGERFNGYTNERFIRNCFTEPILRHIENKEQAVVADLGGNDGFLLDTVLRQVREEKPSVKLSGLVVDIDPTGKAQTKFSEKKKEGKIQELEFVSTDITDMPEVVSDSLDAVISRMTMQYLDEEQQVKFLKEVARILKKEGIFLLQTIVEETGSLDFNDIYKEITKIISGSGDFRRHFPSFDVFTKNIRFEEDYGLKVEFGSRAIEFPFSVKSFADRFQIDIEELEKLYKEKSSQFPELFKTIDGQLCLMARLLNVRFRKI